VKLLIDSCVWSGVRDELAAAGHDAQWAGDWPVDPGDDEILSRAFSDRRTLITLDNDFGELAVHQSRKHSGIVRLVDIHPRKQAAECATALATYGAQLQAGAIVTIEPGRVRVRLAVQEDE
jgi:predicted nuclease of predicted toxin-antitoxin system